MKKIFVTVLLALVLFWLYRMYRPETQTAPPPEAIPIEADAAPASAPETAEANPAAPPVPDVKKPSLTEAQVQAIRAEMKISLSGIYSAQRAYYAEFSTYTTDLRAIGWRPPEHPLPMRVGFTRESLHAIAEGEDPSQRTTDIFIQSKDPNDPQNLKYAPTAVSISLDNLERYCRDRCSASRDRFEVIAAANLDDDETLDIWLINDKKEMIQVSDDLRE